MVVVALVLFGGGYYFFTGDKSAETAPTPVVETAPVAPVAPAPVAETVPVAPAPSMARKYIDGQYSADASYTVPNGTQEKITVSLTLKDGIITAADFTGTPIETGSKFNQGKFREGFKAEVVGKKIDEIALTVVNGASLTSKGFMDALGQIKTKAQTPA